MEDNIREYYTNVVKDMPWSLNRASKEIDDYIINRASKKLDKDIEEHKIENKMHIQLNQQSFICKNENLSLKLEIDFIDKLISITQSKQINKPIPFYDIDDYRRLLQLMKEATNFAKKLIKDNNEILSTNETD